MSDSFSAIRATTGPQISIEQFKQAKDDLLELISKGVKQITLRDTPRITIDVSLLVSYPLQFVRDRDPNPIDVDPPVRFGLRGQDEDWDEMCDGYKAIARNVCLAVHGIDSDEYRVLLTAAPVEGPVIDWVVRLAFKQLIKWVAVLISGDDDLDLQPIADLIDWLLETWV